MSHTEQPIASDMLDRFVDDMLDAKQRQMVLDAAAADPALQAQIDEKLALREALSSHLLQAADAVDFSGFADRLMARIDAEEALQAKPAAKPSLWQSFLDSWRQHSWLYALPVAAAAALIVMVWPRPHNPANVSQPKVHIAKKDLPTHHDSVATNQAPADAEIDIEDIETGTRLAMVYQMPDSHTTMIWISDAADSAAQGSL